MELSTAVDNLYLYDPQFKNGASGFLSAVGGSSASFPINSSSDVQAAMKAHTLVKSLTFDTHGFPGALDLANGSTLQGIDFMVLQAPPQFLRSNARILFLGCNVGEGDAGDQFIDEVGKYLLRGKGGFVGAATSTNVVFDFGLFATETYMAPLSFGRLKVKRFDSSGSRIGSRVVDRHGFRH